MKATKKIVSVTLAIVMLALAFVMPATAAKVYPLVMVDGIFSTKLYQNFGTADEAELFDMDDEGFAAMGKEIGEALIRGFIMYGHNSKDYNKFADSVFPTVNKYLDPIGYNLDGTSKDATIGFYQNTSPMSSYTEEEKAELSPLAQAYGLEYGEENVYNFSYDWRQSPIDIAAELNDYIQQVKDDLGVKKVNVVGMSMGASVVLAYLNAYGGKSINNLVFASPAWQGTSLAGDIAIGNIEADMFTVENYLVQLANVSATTHITAFIISYIATYDGLSKEYFGDINQAIQGILPRLYTDSLIPNLAGMPGFWGLVPKEDYEAGKAYLLGDTIDAGLAAKIDAYNVIQKNAKAIIEKAMKDGMHFGIVLGYNCQMIPINDEYEQSDTIIDVYHMSGGATCAKYLQAHDDWDNIYSQAKKDGHNHVSWDYKVDASTCMFPEYTWFFKNLQHNGYNVDYGTTDIVVWLLGATEQYTVFTDKANYPQFILYNTYKRKVTPINVDSIIGDLDGSGVVTTADARIALKIAAGQIKPTEEQIALGDIDEDGEITTTDATDILSIAAGIDF